MLVVRASGVGEVGSWDVNAGARDGVVGAGAEAKGVSGVEGVARGPSKDGGRSQAAAVGISAAGDAQWANASSLILSQ